MEVRDAAKEMLNDSVVQKFPGEMRPFRSWCQVKIQKTIQRFRAIKMKHPEAGSVSPVSWELPASCVLNVRISGPALC